MTSSCCHCTMTHRLLLIAGAILLCQSLAFAQKPGGTTSAGGAQFRLQVSYAAGVAQAYEIVEQSTTKRTFEDGNVQTYDRTVKYYATLRCIESIDGIATLVVNMDSLEYKFTSEGTDVTYDSQHDITPKNFVDLNNYIGPLNRTYQITVSPYGAVSDVKGEQVEFWRDYLKENAIDLDSVTYMVWMQSLDNDNLLHYGDLQKRVVPGLKVGIDSTWKHNFDLRIDGVMYSDRVTSKFTEYSGGIFKMQMKDTIAARSQDIHTYGLPVVTKVEDGAAEVDHTVELSNTGAIENVRSVAKAWFRGKALNVRFTQETTSTTSWKLTGQYQW